MTTLTPEQDAAASNETLSLSENIQVIAEGFSKLCISENLLKALSDMGFKNPSSIQKEAIPEVLAGNDIIAKAPTGSGKTAAFAIPIIEKLDLSPENKDIQALVLSPTRELAIQVHREFEKLTKYYENIAVVSIYGGQNIERQFNALKKQPKIIVATPGRLMDHLRRGSIKLDKVSIIVLDEADEILDMGFREDIHTILSDAPVNSQKILFSATMPKDIIEIAKKFQKSPNIVDVSDNLMNTPNIEQQYFEVAENNKIEVLTRLLYLHNIKSALVFCNTKTNVDKVVEILKAKGCFADAIHGDMNQSQREKVMRGFRSGSVKILVATDVAGRGIDVKDIDAVFNYDLPRDDEDYIHRIGRTGRAGTSGISFTFISKRQVQSLKRIERANGIQIHKKEIPEFEEIKNVIKSSFTNEIKTILENDDLSEYITNVESMLSNEIDATSIAAALLKIHMEKEDKKINKNTVFEDMKDEPSEKHRRNRRDRRDRRNRSHNSNNNSEESDNKTYNVLKQRKSSKSDRKKNKMMLEIEDMISTTQKHSKNKSEKKSKFSDKFSDKFTYKTKSKSKFGNRNRKKSFSK